MIAERDKVLPGRSAPKPSTRAAKDKQRYVLIPLEATSTQPATTAAAVVAITGPAASAAKAENAERNVVAVGIDDGAFCEIVSGLTEGEKIVLSPTQEEWGKLKNGEEYP